MSSAERVESAPAPRHRPDIDGLRAIAILSVLGFHAFSRVFPGGFVGVDIFFVISGYLISGILLRGLEGNRLQISTFYARRIKRIFPALALVLLATGVAGWYLLLADEFRALAKETAAGAGFVANITYWQEAGYFDQANVLKPLLHLWSLGVEEQFYLVWPLLLAITWKRRMSPLAATLALLLVSFALNVARARNHEAETFYLITSRFWELALGSAYACWEVQRPSLRCDVPAVSHTLAACGLLALLLSIALLHSTVLWPGWWAVLPTAGSLMLIAAGPNAWVNRNVLAARPMVFVGLISYPLYLWHWPLLSFSRIVNTEATTALVNSLLLLLAGLLAWLTYKFVERPVRLQVALGRWAWPLLAVVAALGGAGLLGFLGVMQPRSASYGLEKIIAAATGIVYPGPHLHDLDSARTPLRRQNAGPKTVLFIGDSFIEQYYPRIDWLLQTNSQVAESVVFASGGGCPPIPNVHEKHHSSCEGLVDRAERYAAQPEVNIVVIGANWTGYFVKMDPRYSYYQSEKSGQEISLLSARGTALALAEFEAMISRLTSAGKIVYLVLQSPTDESLDPRRLIQARWGPASFSLRVPNISRQVLAGTIQPITSSLRDIAARSGAHVIDPFAHLCGSFCPLLAGNGLPIYRDEGHLNPAYVRLYVNYLDLVVLPGAPSPPT